MVDDSIGEHEIAVTVDVNSTGVKAAAKSRLIAAVDRFGANLFDLMNSKIEKGISRDRAMIEAERKLIEAAVAVGVKEIGQDAKLAKRIIGNILRRGFEEQINRDAVIDIAVEDLINSPPTEEENHSGPNQLDGAVISKLEHLSGNATDAEVRERFGKILANEIRRPGSVSAKTLRLLEEIDTETASLFRRVAFKCVDDAYINGVNEEIEFSTERKLVESELLSDSGLGQFRLFVTGIKQDGSQYYYAVFGEYGLLMEGIPEPKDTTNSRKDIFSDKKLYSSPITAML